MDNSITLKTTNKDEWEDSAKKINDLGCAIISSNWYGCYNDFIADKTMSMGEKLEDCISAYIYMQIFGYTNSDAEMLSELSRKICGIIGAVTQELQEKNIAVKKTTRCSFGDDFNRIFPSVLKDTFKKTVR